MSDSVVFKYSEFFDNDGGMDKVRTDFIKLGDDIVTEAKRVKKEVNESFSFTNIEVLSQLEGKVDELEKTMKSYKVVKNEVNKTEEEGNRAIKESIKNTDDLAKSKSRLSVKSAQEIVNNRGLAKEADLLAKKNSTLLSVYDKVAAKHEILTRTYRNLLLKQELGISFTAKETAQLGTLQQRYEKYDAALRKSEQGAGQYFRSIGNYKSAYDGLGNSINQLTRELPAFTYSAQTGILALSNNLPILTDEIGRLVKANNELRGQGKPVKSALTAILEGVFSLQTAMGVGILILTVYGKEIGEFISDVLDNTKALQAQVEWLKKANEAIKDRRKALQDNSDFEKEFIKSQEDGTNKIIRLRNAQGENQQKNAIEELNTNLDRIKNFKKATDFELETIEKLDQKRQSTYAAQLKRLEDQKKAEFARAGLSKSGKRFALFGIGVEDVDGLTPKQIADRANKRIADFKRSQFQSQENAKAEIEQKKKEKTDLLIIEQNYAKELKILQEQQATDRLRALMELSQNRKVSEAEVARAQLENAIQNNETIMNSDRFTGEERVAAQQKVVEKMRALNKANKRDALQELKFDYDKEREEIRKNADGTVVTQKYVNDLLLQLLKKYNADKKLVNEEYLQAEIDTDEKARKIMLLQILEFDLQKIKADQKYFSTSAKEYESYYAKIKETQDKIDAITSKTQRLNLGDDININTQELDRVNEFAQRIKDSFGSAFPTALTRKQQKQYIEMLKAFEKEATDIAEDADKQRKLARLNQIEEEKKLATSSIEVQKLEIEKQGILLDLKNQEIKDSLSKNKGILDGYKDLIKQLFPILDAILDRVLEINQKRIESEKNLLDIQRDSVKTQEERSRAGLENTLAFEQKVQAQREADLVKSQKKQERLQKIRALYTSYTNYANKGDNNPVLKALKDFAILEAIAASFGDGGAADDVLAKKIPSDGKGIVRGRSHRGRRGGIPVLIEGKEGFFSGREMANLGKNNFYKIKEAAGSGKIDSNFFSGQHRNFITVVPSGNATPSYDISRGLEDVKKAIENKPVQNLNIPEVIDGIMKLVETTTTKNKVVRNTYVIKKKPL